MASGLGRISAVHVSEKMKLVGVKTRLLFTLIIILWQRVPTVYGHLQANQIIKNVNTLQTGKDVCSVDYTSLEQHTAFIYSIA